jgi:hypothetical protein
VQPKSSEIEQKSSLKNTADSRGFGSLAAQASGAKKQKPEPA